MTPFELACSGIHSGHHPAKAKRKNRSLVIQRSRIWAFACGWIGRDESGWILVLPKKLSSDLIQGEDTL